MMRKTIALTAIVVLLAGCSATGGDDTVATDSGPEDASTSEVEPDETTTTVEPPTEPDETTEPEPTTTTAAPDDGEGTSDAPLAIGERAEVGENYEVEVTGTNLDATDLIADLDEFAEPPDNDAYAIVSLDVTYIGDEEGDPGFDLLVTLQGGNGRQYDDTSCFADTPNSKFDAPTLTNGGSAEVDMCIDYELEAADGGTLFIEDFLSFDEARVYWSLT
ncbi:hypothetical protein BH23ACT2_BH23ACT2_18400 [soil metagenome]